MPATKKPRGRPPGEHPHPHSTAPLSRGERLEALTKMSVPDSLLSRRELSAVLGVTPGMVRGYEKQGWLPPPERQGVAGTFLRWKTSAILQMRDEIAARHAADSDAVRDKAVQSCRRGNEVQSELRAIMRGGS